MHHAKVSKQEEKIKKEKKRKKKELCLGGWDYLHITLT